MKEYLPQPKPSKRPKKVKKKQISIGKLKKKVWAIFSQYIRLKHSKDGYCTCYTCGTVKPIKSMQAGHGIGGRNNAVLFDERLVRPQCVGCNIFGRGQYSRFTEGLIKELGMQEYSKMVTESNKLVQLKRFQLEEMLEDYKMKLKTLVV